MWKAWRSVDLQELCKVSLASIVFHLFRRGCRCLTFGRVSWRWWQADWSEKPLFCLHGQPCYNDFLQHIPVFSLVECVLISSNCERTHFSLSNRQWSFVRSERQAMWKGQPVEARRQQWLLRNIKRSLHIQLVVATRHLTYQLRERLSPATFRTGHSNNIKCAVESQLQLLIGDFDNLFLQL